MYLKGNIQTAIINKLSERQDITPTAGTKKTFMTIKSDEDIKTFNNKLLKEESFFNTVVRQSQFLFQKEIQQFNKYFVEVSNCAYMYV